MPPLRAFAIFSLAALLATGVRGGTKLCKPAALHTATTSAVVYRAFLANALFNYYGNNGDGSFNPWSTDNEGFEFPKGSGMHLVFEDGVLWAGYHKGRVTPKLGGSVYAHGLQPGPLILPGTASTDPVPADPMSPAYRLYSVRPDINPHVSFSSVEGKITDREVVYLSRYEKVTAIDIYDRYVADWNEWPAALGAPFAYGIDAEGRQRSAPAPYDPRFDIPGRPGAAQTLWFVANDMDSTLTRSLGGSPPIGLEVQRTIWGYHRRGAFDQTIFISTLLINKSGAQIDSMYIGQWSDPDVGNPNDDFVGCDTTLGLGFAYNGLPIDRVYGAAVPAVGLALLEGPRVASAADSAQFAMCRRYGYRNMTMSSFVFTLQSACSSDPVGEVQWYRWLRGLNPWSGGPYIDPVTGAPTRFCLSGDPVTSQTGSAGWVDGMGSLPPADRRMMSGVGPFTMAAGDTQEIVVAIIAARGADRLSSVSLLRGATASIRSSFQSLLISPAPPAPPVVRASAFDGEIILTWGDSASVAATEQPVDQGYGFEGYNVYEYASSDGSNPLRLGTFDRIDGIKAIQDTVYDDATGLYVTQLLQVGTDRGIVRSFDFNRSVQTGRIPVNGSPYYLAVTAYSYNASPPAIAGTHCLESSPQIISVTPHAPDPGTRFNQSRGDTITVLHTVAPGARPSDGSVIATVVDPSAITGDTYAVKFRTDTARGGVTWGITDVTRGKSLTSGLTGQSGGPASPIVDGIMVEVYGPSPGMKTGDIYSDPGDTSKWGWWIPSGGRRWSPYASQFFPPLEGFTLGGIYPGTIGNAYDHWLSGSSVTYDRLANVLLRFAATDSTWNVAVPPPDPNFSLSYRYVRHATDTSTFASNPSWRYGIPNKAGGYPYQDYLYGVPFSAWNMDVNPPVRLAVGHLENNAYGGMLDCKWWPPSMTDASNDNAVTAREWWFIFDAPYTTTPDPAFMKDILNTTLPIMWIGAPDMRMSQYAMNDEFMIAANHINSPAQTFTFVGRAPTLNDPTIAKADVTKINVFPNPLKSFDLSAGPGLGQVVTFTHLPPRAILRVFTLAGVLVKTILKDDPGQFVKWDAKNDNGRAVASGVYVVHIQMPDLGSTRILKLGILAETAGPANSR